MKTMPAIPYKEARDHGTAAFPCAYYDLNPQNISTERPFIVKHHWHEEIELIYLQKGAFHLEINMDKYDISEECFCFINSEELHALSSENDFVEKAFVFSPSMLAFAANDPAQQKFIQPLINGDLTLPRFINGKMLCFEELKRIFLQNGQQFELQTSVIHGGQLLTSNPANQLYIKAGLLQILSLLAQNHILQTTSADTDRRVEMIKKVITYMEHHFSDKIYIHDLAELLNMNEQYFCRFFKKIIGKSPIAYLNELRMKQAAKMLLETNHSVMNVCLECGFHNLGNFMHVFKNTYGVTPLHYRNSHDSY